MTRFLNSLFSPAVSALNLHPDTHSLYRCTYFYSVYLSLPRRSSSSLFLCAPQPAIPSVPPRFLTSGSWDVTSLCALDEKAGKMYVSATLCGNEGG